MQFQPKTDQELITEIRKDQEARTLPEGQYEFSIMTCKEEVSKNGNPMIVVQLNVFNNLGKEITLKDWFVPGSNLGLHKFKRFCDSTKMTEMYSSGNINPYDFIAKWGVLETKNVSSVNDNGLPIINIRIKDYIIKEEVKSKIDPEMNDDIPF